LFQEILERSTRLKDLELNRRYHEDTERHPPELGSPHALLVDRQRNEVDEQNRCEEDIVFQCLQHAILSAQRTEREREREREDGSPTHSEHKEHAREGLDDPQRRLVQLERDRTSGEHAEHGKRRVVLHHHPRVGVLARLGGERECGDREEEVQHGCDSCRHEQLINPEESPRSCWEESEGEHVVNGGGGGSCAREKSLPRQTCPSA
jgi:hypothetical protein